MNTPKTDDGTLLKSTDLFSILVAAFKAGEELGQANAKNIYWTSYPKEDVNEAAPKYATKILSENSKDRPSDEGGLDASTCSDNNQKT